MELAWCASIAMSAEKVTELASVTRLLDYSGCSRQSNAEEDRQIIHHLRGDRESAMSDNPAGPVTPGHRSHFLNLSLKNGVYCHSSACPWKGLRTLTQAMGTLTQALNVGKLQGRTWIAFSPRRLQASDSSWHVGDLSGRSRARHSRNFLHREWMN